ncbi:S49 family peptidase [Flavobacterium sp. FZUC8N2.13]|uniref:S49 family peptidase n=1 Tax=Flavobacterium zubiriense TaxID=3138075 RepID=A0ABV4TAR5_9FLAO
MRVDRLLMDLTRGQWAMSFDGLLAYMPIAHKIMMGENVPIVENTSSLMTVVDHNGKTVAPSKDGFIDAPKGSVAVIDMVGPIMKYGGMCSYGAEEIAMAMYAADRNPNIMGIVFNEDGPGGGVNAIGPFIQFGKDKTKPVVAIADQCASLHYWAMCAVADHKMANNNVSAAFGSVGIVASFADNREYLENLGYKFHDIYPPESEHKNLAVKLALEGKYEMITEEHLSPLAIKFQGGVRAACPNLKEEVGVLTGKTFGADDALKYGMIDSIGSLDQAINRLHIMSELKSL